MPTVGVATPRSRASSTSGRSSYTIPVPPVNTINHYDRGRVKCTCDDKHTAAQLSGHTWNIINNKDDHEVYLRHARNDDHYIDSKGRNTSHWFKKKGRVDLDGDGIIECVDSTNVQEVMVCPGTAGKEAAHLQARQIKQLCQAAAPRDYARYHSARHNTAAPPTPERGGMFERRLTYQHRTFDVAEKPTPRVVDKQNWTPRRGEPVLVRAPPDEVDMFRNVPQLRAESHVDVVDQNFALALPSARRERGSSVPPVSAVLGASTGRSVMIKSHLPPKLPHERVHHSQMRIEPHANRDITQWTRHAADPLKREDAYYVKPVQQMGSSGVKFDIITGERLPFWY